MKGDRYTLRVYLHDQLVAVRGVVSQGEATPDELAAAELIAWIDFAERDSEFGGLMPGTQIRVTVKDGDNPGENLGWAETAIPDRVYLVTFRLEDQPIEARGIKDTGMRTSENAEDLANRLLEKAMRVFNLPGRYEVIVHDLNKDRPLAQASHTLLRERMVSRG